MSAQRPAIALSGNIAAGKSMLGRALSRELGLAVALEEGEMNPFLGLPAESGLQTELWFLVKGIEAYRAMAREGGIIERHPREHVAIFAAVKRRRGWLAGEEWELLEQLSEQVTQGLGPPQLLIFLEVKASSALERLRAREDRGDGPLRGDYLAELGKAYSAFIERWDECPVLRVDTDRLDLRESGTLADLVGQISHYLQ